jgi:uncharacterized protein (TIGR04255 family)
MSERECVESTIYEALCEIRFSGGEVPASAILPGVLFSHFNGALGTIEQLPVASIPRPARDADPNLKYLVTHRLSGPDGLIVSVGDHAVSVSRSGKYYGWPDLREQTGTFFQAVLGTNLVGTIERASVKYSNIFPGTPGENHFALINGSVRLGSLEMTRETAQIRVDIEDGGLHSVVQVLTQAAYGTGPGQLAGQGLLLDLDIIMDRTQKDFGEIMQSLDVAHAKANQLYTDISGEKR